MPLYKILKESSNDFLLETKNNDIDNILKEEPKDIPNDLLNEILNENKNKAQQNVKEEIIEVFRITGFDKFLTIVNDEDFNAASDNVNENENKCNNKNS